MQIGIFIVLIVIAATLVAIAKHINQQNKIQIELVNKLEEISVKLPRESDQN